MFVSTSYDPWWSLPGLCLYSRRTSFNIHLQCDLDLGGGAVLFLISLQFIISLMYHVIPALLPLLLSFLNSTGHCFCYPDNTTFMSCTRKSGSSILLLRFRTIRNDWNVCVLLTTPHSLPRLDKILCLTLSHIALMLTSVVTLFRGCPSFHPVMFLYRLSFIWFSSSCELQPGLDAEHLPIVSSCFLV